MTLNVLFFVALILILLMGIRGFQRGILGIIFGLVAWIFMIVFVQWASPQAYENLKNDEKIVASISENVGDIIEKNTEDISLDNAEEALKKDKEDSFGDMLPKEAVEGYEEMMASLQEFYETLSKETDLGIKDQLLQQATEGFNEKKEEVVLGTTEIVTDYILRAIATVISILLGFIICFLVWMIIRLINKTPIIGTASHFGGLIFGIFEGILILWIIMYIASLTSVTEIGGSLMGQIKENEFLLYLYNYNILFKILG